MKCIIEKLYLKDIDLKTHCLKIVSLTENLSGSPGLAPLSFYGPPTHLLLCHLTYTLRAVCTHPQYLAVTDTMDSRSLPRQFLFGKIRTWKFPISTSSCPWNVVSRAGIMVEIASHWERSLDSPGPHLKTWYEMPVQVQEVAVGLIAAFPQSHKGGFEEGGRCRTV